MLLAQAALFLSSLLWLPVARVVNRVRTQCHVTTGLAVYKSAVGCAAIVSRWRDGASVAAGALALSNGLADNLLLLTLGHQLIYGKGFTGKRNVTQALAFVLLVNLVLAALSYHARADGGAAQEAVGSGPFPRPLEDAVELLQPVVSLGAVFFFMCMQLYKFGYLQFVLELPYNRAATFVVNVAMLMCICAERTSVLLQWGFRDAVTLGRSDVQLLATYLVYRATPRNTEPDENEQQETLVIVFD